MIEREKIYNEVKRFSSLGEKTTENNSLLIGNPDKKRPYFWLISLFSPISCDELEKLKEKIYLPNEYELFLMNCCNGLHLFSGTLSLSGYRRNMIRIPSEIIQQPFDLLTPNIDERPKNSKKEYFYFGFYKYDGSRVYINTNDHCVYFCKRYDSTPLYKWDSFDIFLKSEIKRICNLMNDLGEKNNSNCSTLPI